ERHGPPLSPGVPRVVRRTRRDLPRLCPDPRLGAVSDRSRRSDGGRGRVAPGEVRRLRHLRDRRLPGGDRLMAVPTRNTPPKMTGSELYSHLEAIRLRTGELTGET